MTDLLVRTARRISMTGISGSVVNTFLSGSLRVGAVVQGGPVPRQCWTLLTVLPGVLHGRRAGSPASSRVWYMTRRPAGHAPSTARSGSVAMHQWRHSLAHDSRTDGQPCDVCKTRNDTQTRQEVRFFSLGTTREPFGFFLTCVRFTCLIQLPFVEVEH